VDVDAHFRASRGSNADARVCCDPRGRHGSIRKKLAAGVIVSADHNAPCPLRRDKLRPVAAPPAAGRWMIRCNRAKISYRRIGNQEPHSALISTGWRGAVLEAVAAGFLRTLPVMLARQPTNLRGYGLQHKIEHRRYRRTAQQFGNHPQDCRRSRSS
jgi:hypothetical protein